MNQNPKSPNDLDPKLRETYERIMGTSFTPAATQNPNPNPQPLPQAPSATSVSSPKDTSNKSNPLPSLNQPGMPASFTAQDPSVSERPEPVPLEMVPSPDIFKASDPFTEPLAPPAEIIAKNAVVNPSLGEKKKNKFMPIILTLCGILFFVAYTVIWAKVFGLF